MTDVSGDTVGFLNRAVKAKHDRFRAQVKTWWPMLATEEESDGKASVYGFGERTIKMREWKGQRVARGGNLQTFEVTNRRFEATLQIEREHFEDDLLKIYDPQIRSIARAGVKWPDYMLRDALVNGKTALADDGKYFFATDHYQSIAEKSGSQANLFTSKPLTRANLDYVIAQMKGLKAADGEKIDDFGEGMILVVGSDLESTAKELCRSSMIVRSEAQSASGSGFGAVNNVWQDAITPLIVNDLSESGVWYLADNSLGTPFTFQVRVKPDFVPLTDPSNPFVAMQDKYLFLSRSRGEMVGTSWWKIARVEPS